MSTDPVRNYGLIGAGQSGYAHIRALTKLVGARLVAVSEPDTDALNETLAVLRGSQFKPAIYSDWREMISGTELDAVIVATTSDSDFEILTEMMALPLAIFVEVPLCETLKEAKQVAKLAVKRGGVIQVGFDLRTLPSVAGFVERLHAGQVGTPHMMSICASGLANPDMAIDFRSSNDQGATLNDLCGPYLDLMRWAMRDEPVRVFASAGHTTAPAKKRKDKKAPRLFDNAVLTLEFSRGGRAQLNVALFGDPSITVSATGGDGSANTAIPTQGVSEDDAAIVHSLRSFEHAITASEPAVVGVADGLRAIEIGLAAQQSAVSGKVVSI